MGIQLKKDNTPDSPQEQSTDTSAQQAAAPSSSEQTQQKSAAASAQPIPPATAQNVAGKSAAELVKPVAVPPGGAPGEPIVHDDSIDEFQPEQEEESGRSLKFKILHALKHLWILIVDHPRVAMALVVAIMSIPVIYKISEKIYYADVLGKAEDAYEQYQHSESIPLLEDYISYDPEKLEAAILLMKSYALDGNYDKALQTLDNFQAVSSEALPQLQYQVYLALFALMDDNISSANDYLEKAFTANSDYPPAYFLQAAVYYYGEESTQSAVSAINNGLNKIASGGSGVISEEGEAQMLFIRRVLYANNPFIASEKLPLPFTELTEIGHLESNAEQRQIHLELPVSSFSNTYYVPTERGSLVEERLSIPEDMLLFQAMLHINSGSVEEARLLMSDVEEYIANHQDSQESLYYLYANAFIHVKEGNYTAARDIYKKIKSRVISADVNIMLAAALWAINAGASPTQEIIDVYEEVIAQEPDHVVAMANLAYMYIYKGELEKAGELLERGFSLAPGNFSVVYNLSFLDILSGDLERAKNNLYALRSVHPDSFLLALALANLLIVEGNDSEAIAELNDLKTYQETPEIYMEIANLYRLRSQPLLVIAELVAARKAFPDNDDILFDLLLEYARQGDFKKYTAIRKISPQDILLEDSRALLAEALLRKEQPAKAKGYYSKAVEKATTDLQREDIFLYWLRRTLENGDDEEAQDVLQQAQEAFDILPQSIEVLELWIAGLGDIDKKKQRALAEKLEAYKDRSLPSASFADIGLALVAIGAHERGIEVLLENSDVREANRVLNGLKFAYAQIGENDKVTAVERRIKAIAEAGSNIDNAAYIRAVKRIKAAGLTFACSDEDEDCDNRDGGVSVASGDGEFVDQLNAAVAAQDYQEAIDIYAKLLELDEPPFTPAIMYQNRGVLHMKQEDFDLAAEDFEHALSIEDGLKPNDRNSVLYNYALALAKRHKYREGADAIKQLLDSEKDNLRALVLYAQLLNKLRDYEELINIYKQIIEASPGHINSYFELARVQRLTNDVEGAIETMKSASALRPNSKNIHRELAELYSIIGESKKAQEHIDIMNKEL